MYSCPIWLRSQIKTRKFLSLISLTAIILSSILISSCGKAPLPTDPIIATELSKSNLSFSFAITSDVHEYAGDYPTFFKGACEAIASKDQGSFMVTLGDMTPPEKIYQCVQAELGGAYPWYPVVGNHDIESEIMIKWLRNYNSGGRALPNIVNPGPPGSVETSYSFDYGQVHIAVINEYFDGNRDDGGDGDVVDELYDWLAQDLNQSSQPIKLVMGHEAAFPQPDMENGLIRHQEDSLNAHVAHRDRFWELLRSENVLAYFCGHSHTYSHFNFQGVWQINCSHTKGSGDTTSRSTFLLVHVDQNNKVICDTYRITNDYRSYYLASSINLN